MGLYHIDVPDLIRTLENDRPSTDPREMMKLDGLFWRVTCSVLAIPSEWLSQTYFLDNIHRQRLRSGSLEYTNPPPFTTAIPAEFFTMLYGKGFSILTATHWRKGAYAHIAAHDHGGWQSEAPTVPQAACAAFLKAICGNMTSLHIPD